MPSSPSPLESRLRFGPQRPVVSRIVVPVLPEAVGRDRGVEVATAWATRWHLRLLLLGVEVTDAGAVDLAAGEHLARAVERLGASGAVPVEELMLSGPDVATVVAGALEPGDLVVMASLGATAHVSASHGWQVVRAVGGPVVLVGPEVHQTVLDGPVVLGLDGSPLAEQAIAPAQGLAGALGARLWVVEAADPAAVALAEQLRDRGEQVSTSAYLRTMAERLATGAWDAAHDEPLSTVAAPAGGSNLDVGWELVQGADPVSALVDFVAARRASALVLGTHGRSGLRADIFGSTCMGAVAHSTAPVVVLMPEHPAQAELR